MLRRPKHYIPYKNYSRMNYPNNKKIKIPISYILIFTLILSSILVLIKLPKNTKTIQNHSRVLSATSKNKSIKLNLPAITTKPAIIIPKKKDNAQNITIPAKNVFLYDADNAYPLYEKNSDDHVPIASTTKIMTAILVIENYKLDQIVTVPSYAANIGGSLMHLHTGEKITVESLLYGLMLPSGNDAAYSLASLDPGYKEGNVQSFIDKMNNKAKMLGMDNTHYLCPAGLNDQAYSTAHDLAIITAYAIKNSTFRQIINTPTKTVSSIDNYYIHNLENTNRLVVPKEALYLPFAIGGKTGNTDLAGHCLVNAATYLGHTLISVVLHTSNPSPSESARLNNILLTWGFTSFTWDK